jgi:hypothetical protein
MGTILSTAALSKAKESAKISYSLGITGLLAAVDDSGLKSLDYVGDGIGKRPMSTRFRYVFAIIHRYYRNHELADEYTSSDPQTNERRDFKYCIYNNPTENTS